MCLYVFSRYSLGILCTCIGKAKQRESRSFMKKSNRVYVQQNYYYCCCDETRLFPREKKKIEVGLALPEKSLRDLGVRDLDNHTDTYICRERQSYIDTCILYSYGYLGERAMTAWTSIWSVMESSSLHLFSLFLFSVRIPSWLFYGRREKNREFRSKRKKKRKIQKHHSEREEERDFPWFVVVFLSLVYFGAQKDFFSEILDVTSHLLHLRSAHLTATTTTRRKKQKKKRKTERKIEKEKEKACRVLLQPYERLLFSSSFSSFLSFQVLHSFPLFLFPLSFSFFLFLFFVFLSMPQPGNSRATSGDSCISTYTHTHSQV